MLRKTKAALVYVDLYIRRQRFLAAAYICLWSVDNDANADLQGNRTLLLRSTCDTQRPFFVMSKNLSDETLALVAAAGQPFKLTL